MAWDSRQGRGRSFPMDINLSLAEGHPVSRLAPGEALASVRAAGPQRPGLTPGCITEALSLPHTCIGPQGRPPSLGLMLQARSLPNNGSQQEPCQSALHTLLLVVAKQRNHSPPRLKPSSKTEVSPFSIILY